MPCILSVLLNNTAGSGKNPFRRLHARGTATSFHWPRKRAHHGRLSRGYSLGRKPMRTSVRLLFALSIAAFVLFSQVGQSRRDLPHQVGRNTFTWPLPASPTVASPTDFMTGTFLARSRTCRFPKTARRWKHGTLSTSTTRAPCWWRIRRRSPWAHSTPLCERVWRAALYGRGGSPTFVPGHMDLSTLRFSDHWHDRTRRHGRRQWELSSRRRLPHLNPAACCCLAPGRSLCSASRAKRSSPSPSTL